MTEFSPTSEQSTIVEAARSTPDNLMLIARAGCGKTATLKLIDAAIPGPHLYVVFNKSAAKDAIASEGFASTTTIKTFNSIGHRIWADHCAKKLSLDKNKVKEIFKGIVEDAPKTSRKEIWAEYDVVTNGVNLARALGYIPISHAKHDKGLCAFGDLKKCMDERPSDLAHTLISRVLTISIAWAYSGVIDFNDQVYMPALFGGNYPRFPLVMIDEYQDLSPINHAMVAKLCRHSRQIGVGDGAQAIYAFRGAMDGSMDQAINQFNMYPLPLSTSFRCPSHIVDNVRWRVPEFQAAREGGTVETSSHTLPAEGSTVICRNNAPLMSLAMKMLAQGRSVDVQGSDVSARLVRQMERLGDESMSQTETLSAIDHWQSIRESADSKSGADTAECMRVFARHGRTLGQAIAYARHLFAQSGQTKFLTGHKAKGLEWEHVYHLDNHLLRDHGQDPNLRYVIDTRTKDRLTYINSGEI